MPPRAKQYAIAVSGAGGILSLAAVPELAELEQSAATMIRFLAFLIPAIATSVWQMRLPMIASSYSWSFVFVLLAAMHLSLPETMIVAAVAGLLATVAGQATRPSPLMIGFGAANLILSATAAWSLAHHVGSGTGSGPAALAAAAAGYFVTNTVLLSSILARLQGKPLGEVCREWYRGPFIYFLIGVTLIGLVPLPGSSVPGEAWLLLIPLLYLVHFFHGLSRGQNDGSDQQNAAAGMPMRARIHLSLVILLGSVLLGYGMRLWDSPDAVRFAAFLLASAVLSACKVKLPRTDTAISLGFILTLAAIAQLSLPETMLIAGLSTLVQAYWKPVRKPLPIQALFNFFSLAISSAAAFGVSRFALESALADSPAAFFAVAATVLYGVNSVIVAVMIAQLGGKPLSSVWQWSNFWMLPYYLVGAAAAAVVSSVGQHAGWQASLLVLPLMALLHVSYRLKVQQFVESAASTRH
ncbi:MAG: hypothetical protein R2762_21595 [Bryobacteraceae bacterium]